MYGVGDFPNMVGGDDGDDDDDDDDDDHDDGGGGSCRGNCVKCEAP